MHLFLPSWPPFCTSFGCLHQSNTQSNSTETPLRALAHPTDCPCCRTTRPAQPSLNPPLPVCKLANSTLVQFNPPLCRGLRHLNICSSSPLRLHSSVTTATSCSRLITHLEFLNVYSSTAKVNLKLLNVSFLQNFKSDEWLK
jgi:hypothetical protein